MTSERVMLRYENPGHVHHGRLVAKHRRGVFTLQFTDDPAEARTVPKNRLYEWNAAFIKPVPLT